MVDYDEIFKKSIKTLNEGFELSKNDLILIIEKISQTIKKNSNDSFSLVYWSIDDTIKASIFRVVFDPDFEDLESDTIPIGDFLIPSKGYPIFQGYYRKGVERFDKQQEFKNKTDIENFFVELLSDPDSPLIQAIGYGLRQIQKPEDDS